MTLNELVEEVQRELDVSFALPTQLQPAEIERIIKQSSKWFYENYSDYETFINDIQSAFQEYNQALGFNYVDFHGDNLMQDKYGQVKLIDL